jgi:hypothetical protein
VSTSNWVGTLSVPTNWVTWSNNSFLLGPYLYVNSDQIVGSSIEITTDGTPEGTTVTIAGRPVVGKVILTLTDSKKSSAEEEPQPPQSDRKSDDNPWSWLFKDEGGSNA